jgi:hypothetical protein
MESQSGAARTSVNPSLGADAPSGTASAGTGEGGAGATCPRSWSLTNLASLALTLAKSEPPTHARSAGLKAVAGPA